MNLSTFRYAKVYYTRIIIAHALELLKNNIPKYL